MKNTLLLATASLLVLCNGAAQMRAQTGPFSPESWPPTIDSKKMVHYVVTDQSLSPPGATWLADELQILNSNDQTTQPITIGGHVGAKATSTYLNIADQSFGDWANQDTIDILVQVYGDAAVLDASGNPRNYNFLTGTLPELNAPNGGQIPVEGKNGKWNWVLFRIPNATRPSDGSRYVGSIPANAQGGTTFGGVNGGTIRFQNVPNLIVRVVAFGEQGAFGEPDAINLFAPPDTCDPEPNTNLVGIDLNAGTTNYLSVLNNGDQTVTFQSNVGPADDKRKAVGPNGAYLNFGILSNYLGKACNDPHAMKVCVDFYDDPAFAGANVQFGPEAYATDAKGGTNIYPSSDLATLQGTGKWIRRSWTVPSVALHGVNTGTLTGGPRLIAQNAPVFVSRIEMAVLRTGSHPLAGIDPLADCYEDPAICTTAYGNYAELDLGKGVKNGLDLGTSGGDQEMIEELSGPANDKRDSIRPAREDGTPGFAHQYLNFAITDQVLGPNTQDPALLAICVTYYDDPALVGARFKPEVYYTEQFGIRNFGFTPDSDYVALEGTDQWRTAYWEITGLKFNGVNQGPQAAARFILSDKIHFTRVRYGVIRPCGPNANVNPVADCAPAPVQPSIAAVKTTSSQLQLSWPSSADGYTVQSTLSLRNPQWRAETGTPTLQGNQYVLLVTPSATTFYRLTK